MSKTISGAKSAAITTAALIFSGALNFLGIFIWVRVLGPHEFGIYALVSGVGLFLNSMLFEWMRGVSARTLYRRDADFSIHAGGADALLRCAAIIALVFALIATALWTARIGGPGFGPEWLPLIVLFTISEMALAQLNVVSRIRMLPWQFFGTMVARAALAIVLGLVLVLHFRLGAIGVMLGVVVAQLATAVAVVIRDPMWRTLRIGRTARDDAATRREVLALGAPLIVSTALTYGAGILDRYLVEGVLGTAMVGYYTAPADMLLKTLGFVMLALNIATYPAMVRAYDDHGREAARKVLDDTFVAQLLLGLPAIVACVMLPSGLSNLLLGKAYHDVAVTLLPWVGATSLLRFLVSNHLVMVFQMERRMRLMLIPPLVTLAVLIPAGIAGMHAAGLLGMAWGALAAQAACWIVCAVLAKRIFPFSLFNRDIAKIIVACAIMAGVLYPLRTWTTPGGVLLAGAIGGAVFVVALLVLRLDRAAPVMAKLNARRHRG